MRTSEICETKAKEYQSKVELLVTEKGKMSSDIKELRRQLQEKESLLEKARGENEEVRGRLDRAEASLEAERMKATNLGNIKEQYVKL